MRGGRRPRLKLKLPLPQRLAEKTILLLLLEKKKILIREVEIDLKSRVEYQKRTVGKKKQNSTTN